MSDVVLREIEDGVALLTLNRPDRLNAWTPELQTLYFDLLEDCAAREDVRAIVVMGAGRGFCAGADMQHLQAVSSGDIDRSQEAAGATTNGDAPDTRPVAFPLSIPKPVIAAINGPCAGIGLVLAVMCDLRFAAADAKITTAFARRGLVAEHGISWMLPRLVGPARALDLLLSSRIVLGAEAAELGLVNLAVEDGKVVDYALSYARELARECSPASMAAMKRQVYADYDRTLPETVEDANRLMLESFKAPDFAEGVQSFLERRSPNFAPVSSSAAAPTGVSGR
jgi:enoyl-CoA hydratase/carnithine racemase